jgi:hypothetical protein
LFQLNQAIWRTLTFDPLFFLTVKGSLMSNPIYQIVSDELYTTLLQLNLLNKKVLRDFEIKRKYLELRRSGLKSADAIDHILEEHMYLQFDTVRKIIYSVKLPEELESSCAEA